MFKRILALLLVLLLLPIPVSADAPTEIHTVEDLLRIADDPNADYILMEDLDMTGVEWSCPDFSGSFDGNDHAILNLYLSKTGETTANSYDGNRKVYETSYAGLFGTLVNAQVKDLKLLNVRGVVESDTPCFVGAIAGYSEYSTITGCTVSGCLELRAHDRMFGLGGAVGFGSGTVEKSKIDMTLICVDTDAETKDEQFLGGVYANGFIDVLNCEVIIDGYVSEHGYCHNGGIVGMYMEYPWDTGSNGRIANNSVTGKITFFEDNSDRRAYCKAIVGESLVYYAFQGAHSTDFQRDERKDYSQELRPEMCESPSYTETVVAPGCSSYGYTRYQCSGCGYEYTDRYTLFSHTVTTWTLTEAPTTEKEGLSTASCDLCGKTFTRTEEKLEPEPTETEPPTTAPTQPQSTQPAPLPEGEPFPLIPVLIGAGAVIVIGLLLLLLRKPKGGKYLKK